MNDEGSDDLVMTPDVVSERLSRALRILETAGLGWEVQRGNGEAGTIGARDVVQSQSPVSNYLVTSETIVRLRV
jgi:hypothetical protein